MKIFVKTRWDNAPQTTHHIRKPPLPFWKHFLAPVSICVLLSGCVDDHGKGAMHAATSRCFSKYPLAKGTAYKRFSCIYQAHAQYGPDAMGTHAALLKQIDQASLRVGLDIDSGVLTVAEGETALHWVTRKAYYQASQHASPQEQPKTQGLRK